MRHYQAMEGLKRIFLSDVYFELLERASTPDFNRDSGSGWRRWGWRARDIGNNNA